VRPILLFVVNIPRFFVSHRLPLALAARDAGYDVHVATADDDPENLAVIRAAGLALHPIPLAQHGRRPLDEVRTILALISLYARLHPDVLHHITIKPLLYGGIAGRLTRRRAVIGAMSGLGRAFRDESGTPRQPGLLLRLALRLALRTRATHLLFQNEDDRDIFLGLGVADERRVALIRGSGVDLERFRPTPEPVALDRRPIVLYSGRLMWQKGLGSFVDVAGRLGQSARFVVAGYTEPGSPDAVPLEELERWAAEGRIDWLGRRDDMPRVLADANIVVLPTLYGEGVPKALIEAAASARPIVTSDAPGCRDICIGGVNGLLIPPGDIDALERAVRQLVDDPDLRRRMGAAGRHIAERSFSLERVIDETLALYARVLR
jgi:glycosyltransferase involved in cell wall biosynthesis